MNKAILVMDMPNSCYGCMFHYETYDEENEVGEDICMALQGKTIDENIKKYSKCPLQPMPERSFTGKSEYYQWGDWEDGWNACIDQLELDD